MLENVTYVRVYNSEQQYKVICDAFDLLKESQYKLIIVDGVTSLFRAEFQGPEAMLERHNALVRVLRGLKGLCEEFGVAIVLTNQVADQVSVEHEPDFDPQSATRKPVGDYLVGKAATARLALSKAFRDVRCCEIYASADLPAGRKCMFTIKEGGVCDAGFQTYIPVINPDPISYGF